MNSCPPQNGPEGPTRTRTRPHHVPHRRSAAGGRKRRTGDVQCSWTRGWGSSGYANQRNGPKERGGPQWLNSRLPGQITGLSNRWWITPRAHPALPMGSAVEGRACAGLSGAYPKGGPPCVPPEDWLRVDPIVPAPGTMGSTPDPRDFVMRCPLRCCRPYGVASPGVGRPRSMARVAATGNVRPCARSVRVKSAPLEQGWVRGGGAARQGKGKGKGRNPSTLTHAECLQLPSRRRRLPANRRRLPVSL